MLSSCFYGHNHPVLKSTGLGLWSGIHSRHANEFSCPSSSTNLHCGSAIDVRTEMPPVSGASWVIYLWHLGCVTLLFGGSILWYNIFGNITDSFLYPLAFQAKTLNDSTTRPSSGDHECSLKCRLRMSELSALWCLICWQFARSAPMTLRWLGRCTATPFTDLISYSQQWSTDCWYPSQLQTLHRAHKQQHRSKKLTVSSHDAPLGWFGWEWGWGCKSWIRSHSNSCSEMQCTIVISSKWEEPECLLHLCASCGMWNVLAIN